MVDVCECTDEEWRPVVGYEASYLVSSCGRVWSRARISIGKDGVVKRLKGGPRALTTSDGRYCSVGLSRGDGTKALTRRVHILVAEAFHGPRPSPEHEVCHEDDNGQNNHASNLRWDTKSGNNRDKERHGTNYESNKQRCRRGHSLVEPNLVPSTLARGGRACRACSLAYRVLHRRTPDGVKVTTTPEFILLAAQRYVEIMATDVAA